MHSKNLPITRTAEFVTPKHPDKLCDRIADTLLDEYLKTDPQSRVALEVTGGHGQIFITGEVTSTSVIDIESIVKTVLGNNKYKIITNIANQSPEIAAGVDTGGAGDQGIVIGYAIGETESLMPTEYVLAKELCKNLYQILNNDGKVQVTINHNDQTVAVVASFQNAIHDDLLATTRKLVPNANEYIINPAGDWSIGGFQADSGTVGRKLAIDNYGPRVRIGGGAFSGKDLSKTDRSGAYFARYLAINILKQTGSSEVEVELAFAIGMPVPVAINVKTIGSQGEYQLPSNLSPRDFIESLDLTNFELSNTSCWGHFGNNFPWEITN